MNLRFTPVVSSNIEGYLYLEERSMLLIAFKSGATYAYEAVPKSVAAAFGNALSKGKFFRAEIRNSFTASKLGESGVVDLLHRPDEPRAVTRCKKSKVSLASLVLRHPILDAVF